MLPDVQLAACGLAGTLLPLQPDKPVDVALYWHHWQVQSPRLARLSEVLVDAARAVLRPSIG